MSLIITMVVMIERIDVDIQTGVELHTVSLEQGVFSIDGEPYHTLNETGSILVAMCMQQPGVVVDWRDITDFTGISARRMGYELATELKMDHTVPFRTPGQSGQSFVSAIFPKSPSKKIDGSISVKGLSGLRFNNKVGPNSTVYDVVPSDDSGSIEVMEDTSVIDGGKFKSASNSSLAAPASVHSLAIIEQDMANLPIVDRLLLEDIMRNETGTSLMSSMKRLQQDHPELAEELTAQKIAQSFRRIQSYKSPRNRQVVLIDPIKGIVRWC